MSEPIRPEDVVKFWRQNMTLGQIAERLGGSVDEIYRLVVLTGEMRRSIAENRLADGREADDE